MNRKATRFLALAGALAPSFASATLLIDDGGTHVFSLPHRAKRPARTTARCGQHRSGSITGDGTNTRVPASRAARCPHCREQQLDSPLRQCDRFPRDGDQYAIARSHRRELYFSATATGHDERRIFGFAVTSPPVHQPCAPTLSDNAVVNGQLSFLMGCSRSPAMRSSPAIFLKPTGHRARNEWRHDSGARRLGIAGRTFRADQRRLDSRRLWRHRQQYRLLHPRWPDRRWLERVLAGHAGRTARRRDQWRHAFRQHLSILWRPTIVCRSSAGPSMPVRADGCSISLRASISAAPPPSTAARTPRASTSGAASSAQLRPAMAFASTIAPRSTCTEPVCSYAGGLLTGVLADGSLLNVAVI